MGYEVAALAAGYHAWTSAALTRKPTGYLADRRRSTHFIAEDAEALADVDTAFANFDMITYAKGNAVLRQLGLWLGADFLTGVNAHLGAHAFANASLSEFLQALDAATDRDVRTWARAWLRSTGFDTIEVTREGEVPVLRRVSNTSHGQPDRPHRFSVAAFDAQMRLISTRLVDLAAQPIRLDDFAGLIVVPNAGDETFAAIRPDEQSWSAICKHLSRVESSLTRAMLWWSAVDQAMSHEMSLGDLVALVESQLPTERHPVVFEAVLDLVLSTVRGYARPEEVHTLLASLTAVASSAITSDDARALPAARALAAITDDSDLLGNWLRDATTDQEVRWAAVRRLAALGHPSHIDAELTRDPSVAGHLAALAARAAVPTEQAKQETWSLLMGGTLSNHEFSAVAAGFWGWEQAELVEPYLRRYFPDALTLANASGQAMGKMIGRAFPRLPLADDVRRSLRDDLAAALATGDVPTVLARQWNDALDDLERVLV